MNKAKLLEMAKECDYGITGYVHNGSKVEYEIWGGSMETHKLNKFAELVIEEALGVVDIPLIERNEIRKHFGMKEEPMPVRDIGLVTTRDWTK
jgi:hypothetical protein